VPLLDSVKHVQNAATRRVANGKIWRNWYWENCFARTSYLINSSAKVINVIYSVEKSTGESGIFVGIGTGHGVESPGIESRWEKGFSPFQTGPVAHPASCSMGTWSFKEVRGGRGVELNNPTQIGRKILEKFLI
jgi:hypothetical protein